MSVIHPIALHRKAGVADKFFSFFTVALTTGASCPAPQRRRADQVDAGAPVSQGFRRA